VNSLVDVFVCCSDIEDVERHMPGFLRVSQFVCIEIIERFCTDLS